MLRARSDGDESVGIWDLCAGGFQELPRHRSLYEGAVLPADLPAQRGCCYSIAQSLVTLMRWWLRFHALDGLTENWKVSEPAPKAGRDPAGVSPAKEDGGVDGVLCAVVRPRAWHRRVLASCGARSRGAGATPAGDSWRLPELPWPARPGAWRLAASRRTCRPGIRRF